MPRRKSPRAKKSTIAVAIGIVLRQHRENAQLTQERFAELVDLSKNYIGNLERGEYEISIRMLNQIARSLKLRASDIVREAGY